MTSEATAWTVRIGKKRDEPTKFLRNEDQD